MIQHISVHFVQNVIYFEQGYNVVDLRSCKAHTSNGSVQLLLLHFYCVFIAPSTVLHFSFTHQLNTSLLDQLLFTCSNSITVFQNTKSNDKECQKDFKCDPQNLGNS